MGKIVLFGATGYTGTLTAQRIVAHLDPDDNHNVVLAGRNQETLDALVSDLAIRDESRHLISTQVANIDDPDSVSALLDSSDDVLISTVGPFVKWGGPALEAAIAVGATYIDSTGEPAFIRRVFEEYGPRAKDSGARLLPAFGYDYVPGNLSAQLAIADAKDLGDTPVDRIEIGYFISGGSNASSGTLASAAGIVLMPSYAWAGGKLRKQQLARFTREFQLADKTLKSVSIGGSEHFDVPAIHPEVQDVGVYLGFAGSPLKVASYGSRGIGAAMKVPGMRPFASALSSRFVQGSNGGPDTALRARSTSIAIAEAFDDQGNELSRVVLKGPSPYDLTADLLAWSAFNADEISDTGALGPTSAFGLPLLTRGCSSLGLVRES